MEAFFKLSGIAGEILEEREAPDFLIQVEGEQVGVELTEVYVPVDGDSLPLKAKESQASKIVAEARHHYEAQGGAPLHVAVGFSPRTDFRTLNRTLTARALTQFLLRQQIPRDRAQSWKPTLHGPLPLDINFVNAVAVSSEASAHWYAPQAGWIVPLTVQNPAGMR